MKMYLKSNSLNNLLFIFVVSLVLIPSSVDLLAETTLKGDVILQNLRSYDAGPMHEFTLIMDVESLANALGPGKEIKKCRTTLTTVDGSWGLEKEYSYSTTPFFRKLSPNGMNELYYDKEGNFLVWRVMKKSMLLKSDFCGIYKEMRLLRVNPEGIVVKEETGSPLVELYDPSDPDPFWEIKYLLWSAGRGFSNNLKKIEEASESGEGLINFVAAGTYGTYQSGTWEMTIDPSAGYLVRSAKFTKNERTSPIFISESIGTKLFNSHLIPEYGKVTFPGLGPDDEIVIRVEFIRLDSVKDNQLFGRLQKRLKGTFQKEHRGNRLPW